MKPYTGYLLYSFHVKPGTYEVGVIYVRSPELRKLGIKELHLVKAIKMKNNPSFFDIYVKIRG